MRWFWIDRFEEFVSGRRAVAVKSVCLAEEAVDEYAPGRPYLPSSLIIEGMAQAAGLLVCQISDFQDRVVLAKVQKSVFHFEAYPGTTLKYDVELQSCDANGAFAVGTSWAEGELQAEISLMFAILNDERFEGVQLFEPAGFARMCRLLGLFEVGVNEDGTPISVPQHFLDAEAADLMRYSD